MRGFECCAVYVYLIAFCGLGFRGYMCYVGVRVGWGVLVIILLR